MVRLKCAARAVKGFETSVSLLVRHGRLGEDFVDDGSVAVKDEDSALAVDPDPKV